MLSIDHVIFCVDDLDAAARRLRARYGLASVPGGRHLDAGTANEIVPFGEDYLELVAVVDDDTASRSPFGRWVGEQAAQAAKGTEGMPVAAVCLRTDRLDGIADHLGSQPVAMTRDNAAGRILSWRLVGLEDALAASLPFFITWDSSPDLHPGREPADHSLVVSGIGWVEIGGHEARLWPRLGRERVPLRPIGGAPGYGRVGLSTPAGSLVLGRARR